MCSPTCGCRPKQHSCGVCSPPAAPGSSQQLSNSPGISLGSATAALCTCTQGAPAHTPVPVSTGEDVGMKQGHFGSGWLDSWGKDHNARPKCETWLYESLQGLLHIPQHTHLVSTSRTLHVFRHLCSLFPLTHNERTFSLLLISA